jgi:hypothetical protein
LSSSMSRCVAQVLRACVRVCVSVCVAHRGWLQRPRVSRTNAQCATARGPARSAAGSSVPCAIGARHSTIPVCDQCAAAGARVLPAPAFAVARGQRAPVTAPAPTRMLDGNTRVARLARSRASASHASVLTVADEP